MKFDLSGGGFPVSSVAADETWATQATTKPNCACHNEEPYPRDWRATGCVLRNQPRPAEVADAGAYSQPIQPW